MQRLLHVNSRLVISLALTVLALVLTVAFGSPERSAAGLTAQVFQSPIKTPTPLPSPSPSPAPPAVCPSQTRWGRFEANVQVEGLPGAERARLRLQPISENITACLAERGVALPEMAFGNGSHRMQLSEIPDGAYYKLTVQAPPSHFRDPAGYLFQVQDGQIVRRPDFVFRFQMVPPSQQTLPPCREFEKRFTPPPAPTAREQVIPAESQRDVCWAERTIDISSPPKQPERPREAGILSEGYHYVGPVTYQDNQGVWGRNTVVNPNVPHPGPAGNRFVVERVYANDASWAHWIEAGWVEISWRDDRQYIYEYDSANEVWTFFDEYWLTPGSTVETDVQYDPSLGRWKARYHLGGGYWRVLATADLGFVTADRGYNRGEIFTADGVHPILPLSGFDTGYLLIDGMWRLWTNSYATDVNEDDPYQVDMLSQYYRFNIHSPMVFIPLVLNNAQ